MIDKNGKLFGKVSIVDLVVVIAVLIAAAGIYVRFFSVPDRTSASDTKFHYTLLAKSIRENSADALEKSIGQPFQLFENGTGDMGKLIRVEKTAAQSMIELSDGSVAAAEIPERCDVLLTFEITGKVSEKGYFSSALEDVSAGVFYNIKGKWCAVYGKVQKVWQ